MSSHVTSVKYDVTQMPDLDYVNCVMFVYKLRVAAICGNANSWTHGATSQYKTFLPSLCRTICAAQMAMVD